MSIRVAIENQPEFFTNLDVLRGQVLLSLSRNEQIGAIIVKLEGESVTALGVPPDTLGGPHGYGAPQRYPGQSDHVLYENHKILYKIAQVFPEESASPMPGPRSLPPGQHRFNFSFKFPFNNACSDPAAMARIGGLAGPGGFGSGGLFGVGGGIRVMDGSRQLLYKHVTKTLPPSFTGFPGEAEIRYYIKVTIQRPGMFKENWRHQMGLKFLPIEPPRPPKTSHEAYARRPFAFLPRTPPGQASKRKSGFLSGWHGHLHLPNSGNHPPESPTVDGKMDLGASQPPSIEMSARLPHPAIVTCNKPIPLRLIAKKLVPVDAEVYLVALQVDLVGKTMIRAQDLINTETTRWIVVSKTGLSIPVSQPGDEVGKEVVVPNSVWNDAPLPNTVMPSFKTCNLGREYQLEIKVGLAWGKPLQPSPSSSSFFHGSRGHQHHVSEIPQELHLPLHFTTVEVYSGLTPPEALVKAMRQRGANIAARPGGAGFVPQQGSSAAAAGGSRPQPPTLPPRPTSQQPHPSQSTSELYPPQLRPGQTPESGIGGGSNSAPAPAYDDAPPTYEEAMAEEMTGPMIPTAARPAYSGVTNENEPSGITAPPEKR